MVGGGSVELADPPLSGKEVDVMKEFSSSLEDLTFNSKPLINMLTMLAEENRASARAIVLAIEYHLRKVPTEVKLPVLYLIDSIIKNVGSPYSTLFNQNIVQMFCSVFEKGDEKTRVQLFKLRHTWNQMLPPAKLYALDVHVHNFDPAWPVQQLPITLMTSQIHVNPKFLPPHVQSGGGGAATTTTPATTTATTPAVATVAPLAISPVTTAAAATNDNGDAAKSSTSSSSSSTTEATLRENLRRKQKKLLELRRKKLELELLQTKEKLREQEMIQQQQQAAIAVSNTDVTTGSGTSPTHVTSPLSSAAMVAKIQQTTAATVAATGAPVMRIAPVSSQLLSAVQKRATRDPRLMRGTQATTKTVEPITPATVALTKSEVTSKSADVTSLITTKSGSMTISSASKSSSMASKSSSMTSSSTKSGDVTSLASKSSSMTSSGTKSGAVTSKSGDVMPKSGDVTSLLPKSSSITSSGTKSGVVTSKSGDVTSKSSSATSLSSKTGSVTSSGSKSSGVPSSASKRSSVMSSGSKSSSVISGSKSGSVTSSGSKSGSVTSSSTKSGVVTSKSGDVTSKSSSVTSSPSKGDVATLKSNSVMSSVSKSNSVTSTCSKSGSVTSSVSKSGGSTSSPSKSVGMTSSVSKSSGVTSPVPSSLVPPTSGKRLSEERDVPPPKKTKVMDRFDELFGETAGGDKVEAEAEAVHLTPPCQAEEPPKSSPPSSAPATADSTETEVAPLAEENDTNSRSSTGGRWKKYKAHRQTSETGAGEPYPRSTRHGDKDKETDRLGRPLLYRHGGKSRRRGGGDCLRAGGAVLKHLDEQDEDSSSPRVVDGEGAGGSDGQVEEESLQGGGVTIILKQAEEQLNAGNLSSANYNQIIKEVIAMNELKKLDEARRKEEREQRRSRRKYRSAHAQVTESQKENKVNGDDKTVNDMEISTEDEINRETIIEVNDPIKDAEKETATNDKAEEDTKMIYEPLQPPPMPPAFLPRRSSEEDEVEVKKEEKEDVQKQNSDVDLRQKDGSIIVQDESDVKKEVLPTQMSVGDVDNRLGFPPISLAALSPPQEGLMAKDAVTNPFAGPAVPAVINSTKDIDLRIGLQRPPLGMPPAIPMETDFGAEKISADSSTSSVRLPVPAGASRSFLKDDETPKGPMPPGTWGPGAPWMMPPVPCWPTGAPQGAMPPGLPVLPLRPPPIPPSVMFEPDRLRGPPLGGPPPPPSQLMSALGGAAGVGGHIDLPAADLSVLEAIADDTMKSIEIDGTPRDIRYYGNTAVVFLSWDDPREILFQATGPRKLIIDDRQSVMLAFNAPYQEVLIDGHTYPVRLGGPTRELYVGTQFYQVLFGGPAISVALGDGDRLHRLQLEGPPPQVRIGRPRRDLCLGKITLIVDARHHYTIYLDPKAQRFDLDGVPHIIRFVQALETTVINGVPFKFEFGGLPRPLYSRGKKHYVRLTSLPQGVVPGYVDILGMEGGRRGTAPPQALPSRGLPHDTNSQGSDGPNHTPPNGGSPRQDFLHDDRSMSMMDTEAALMEAPPTGQFRKHQNSDTNKPKPSNSSRGGNSVASGVLGELNIQELFEKLVATGIVPTASGATSTNQSAAPAVATNQERAAGGGDQSDAASTTTTTIDTSHIDTTTHASDKIEFVDFGKPQTLKTRQPGLIQQLYSGIQCSSCGVRFAPEQTIKYSQHLDWHFRQNRRERDSARMVHSRTWYYDLADWTQFEEIEDIEQRALSWFDTHALADAEGGEGSGGGADGGAGGEGGEGGLDVPSVACDSGAVDVRCALCQDRFDIFYNEDKEEWHVRRACKQDNAYYHPLCWEDHLASMKTPPPEPEEPASQQPIASITIDEDDSEEGSKMKEDEEGKEKDGEEKKEEEDDDDDVIIQEPEHKMEIIELLKDDDDEEDEECERKEDGDESSSKQSTDKKDSEDGNTVDSTSKPSDFHTVLRNIKKEKIDVEETHVNDEIIDLETSSANLRQDGDELVEEDEEEEQTLGSNQPPPVVDTTQVKVACSIDGNVELDDSGAANMMAAPSKIKINISKPATTQAAEHVPATKNTTEVVAEQLPPPVAPLYRSQPPLSASMVVPLDALVESSQPPPPGEEPGPLNLKPRLIGHKLTELQPVSRGTELSGLCSIM